VTKKDYEALASVFIRTKPIFIGDMNSAEYRYHSLEYGQWKQDVCAVIDVCAHASPKFIKGKFIAACGLPNILDK
jgi:hypothetical protein